MSTPKKKFKKPDEIITEFLHLASHQLLTPLTISQWYTQLLESKLAGEGNESYNDLLQEISNANYRMREIINMMLDTSRVESNRYKIKKDKIQLSNLIGSKLSKLETEFARLGVKTRINNLAQADHVVYSDEIILGKVIELIIHNALKYNRSTPRMVNIGLRKNKSNKILISFVDNGIGIPEPDQKRIFNKFFRAGNAVILEPDGSGLSLYYAKQSLYLLGSKIWFRSRHGGGTVFTVRV